MFGNLFLLLSFIASLIFRLFFVSNFNFAFTFDQARDILLIRQLAVGHDLVFIGPVTSINGVYLGPFWFYSNLAPFLAGRGDPTYLVYWLILFFHLTVLLFFLYFRKTNYSIAFWGSLFFLISPRFFELTSYSLNANATPMFVILFIIFLDRALRLVGSGGMLFLGLLAGLGLQIEAAFGVLFIPLAIFWLAIKRKIGYLKFALGFILTLSPQLLFEIKHRFQMTQTFLAVFFGPSTDLGDRLDLLSRFIDRYHHYLTMLTTSLPGQFTPWLFLLSLIFIVYLVVTHKTKKLGPIPLLSLSLIILSFAFYLLYPYGLKGWWLTNLTAPYLLTIAGVVGYLWQTRRLVFRLLCLGLFIYLVCASLRFYQDRLAEKQTSRSSDRALLLNQLDAIDWTYTEAAGSGFSTYVFTPVVYDLNYQYLYWWYGQKRFGYLPAKLTYQDGVPPYVENNDRYWTNTRPADQLIFLILETDTNFIDRENAWRQQFSNLCKIKTERLTGAIIVEKLTPCQP